MARVDGACPVALVCGACGMCRRAGFDTLPLFSSSLFFFCCSFFIVLSSLFFPPHFTLSPFSIQQEAQKKFIFLTNSSERTPTQLSEKIKRLTGFEVCHSLSCNTLRFTRD